VGSELEPERIGVDEAIEVAAAIGTLTLPSSGTSTSTPSYRRKDSTLMKLADPTRPSLNSTCASTSPAGVSIVSNVVGSVGRFIPFATSVVATPIRQCPHIGTYSSCSLMMIDTSACGLI
jgi:hypothetical protein